MADKTHIEWTDATWNIVTGCTRVSAGCDHCYIERTPPFRMAGRRFDGPGVGATTGVQLHADRLGQPYRWAKPRRVFVNSLADLFHESVPDGFIAQVWDVMGRNPQHTFQVLTKRPARMRAFVTRWSEHDESGDIKLVRGPAETRAEHASGRGQLFADMLDSMGTPPAGCAYPTFDWMEGQRWWPDVLPNVWLGVSVEDQHWADIRIPALLDTPAAVRWISAEPLLGPLCICDYLRTDRSRGVGLDWVVTGGESGPGARPMHPRWAIDIAHDCQDHGVAFLHKQNGAYIPDRAGRETAVDTEGRDYPGRLRRVGKAAAGRELDGRTYDAYPAARVGA